MTQTLNQLRTHPSLQPCHTLSQPNTQRFGCHPQELSQDNNPAGLCGLINECTTGVSFQTCNLVTEESNWEQYSGVGEDLPGSEVSRPSTWTGPFQCPGKDPSKEFWWYLQKWDIFMFFFIKKTSLWYKVQSHKNPVVLNCTLYNARLSLKGRWLSLRQSVLYLFMRNQKLFFLQYEKKI